MEFKWFMIMIVGITFSGALVGVAAAFNDKQIDTTEFAKAGLEECPNPTGYKGDTIWVKDCNMFLKENK